MIAIHGETGAHCATDFAVLQLIQHKQPMVKWNSLLMNMLDRPVAE